MNSYSGEEGRFAPSLPMVGPSPIAPFRRATICTTSPFTCIGLSAMKGMLIDRSLPGSLSVIERQQP